MQWAIVVTNKQTSRSHPERAEVDDGLVIIERAAAALLPGVRVVGCGSYRRGDANSGDIDVLFTHDAAWCYPRGAEGDTLGGPRASEEARKAFLQALVASLMRPGARARYGGSGAEGAAVDDERDGGAEGGDRAPFITHALTLGHTGWSDAASKHGAATWMGICKPRGRFRRIDLKVGHCVGSGQEDHASYRRRRNRLATPQGREERL